MIEISIPIPLLYQRLQAGPLSAHIDTSPSSYLTQGYAL